MGAGGLRDPLGGPMLGAEHGSRGGADNAATLLARARPGGADFAAVSTTAGADGAPRAARSELILVDLSLFNDGEDDDAAAAVADLSPAPTMDRNHIDATHQPEMPEIPPGVIPGDLVAIDARTGAIVYRAPRPATFDDAPIGSPAYFPHSYVSLLLSGDRFCGTYNIPDGPDGGGGGSGAGAGGHRALAAKNASAASRPAAAVAPPAAGVARSAPQALGCDGGATVDPPMIARLWGESLELWAPGAATPGYRRANVVRASTTFSHEAHYEGPARGTVLLRTDGLPAKLMAWPVTHVLFLHASSVKECGGGAATCADVTAPPSHVRTGQPVKQISSSSDSR